MNCKYCSSYFFTGLYFSLCPNSNMTQIKNATCFCEPCFDYINSKIQSAQVLLSPQGLKVKEISWTVFALHNLAKPSLLSRTSSTIDYCRRCPTSIACHGWFVGPKRTLVDATYLGILSIRVSNTAQFGYEERSGGCPAQMGC